MFNAFDLDTLKNSRRKSASFWHIRYPVETQRGFYNFFALQIRLKVDINHLAFVLDSEAFAAWSSIYYGSLRYLHND